ncbi:MAG: hypothetical protein ACRYG2_36250 [Janthinobacterium lividum]
MYQHVPLGSLGSPGLSVPYDQLGSRSRPDLPWPPERRPRLGPPRRRGLLRRVVQPLRLASGTR